MVDKNEGDISEAAAFLNETVVELHFRDQNDQRLHFERLQRGEPPRKVTIAEIMHEIV